LKIILKQMIAILHSVASKRRLINVISLIIIVAFNNFRNVGKLPTSD
jgi:hypothetical protein